METKKTTINLPVGYMDEVSRFGISITENLKEALDWLIAVKRGGIIQMNTRPGLPVEIRRIVIAYLLEGAEVVFRDADGFYPGTLNYDIEKRAVIVTAERITGEVVGVNISLPLAVQWVARNDPDFFRKNDPLTVQRNAPDFFRNKKEA